MIRVGHFIPAYTPIAPNHSMQLLREKETVVDRLGYDHRVWTESQSDIVAVRNRALKRAMDWDLDYLVMQDADIYSKSRIGVTAPLMQTAREHKATVVAAICGLRRKPHVSNVHPCHPGKVYEGEKCGTGIVLIDVKAVKALGGEGRWFWRTYNADGTQIEIGEDIWFAKWVRERGGTVWIDGRVPTTHVMDDHETLDYPGNDATQGGQSAEATAA